MVWRLRTSLSAKCLSPLRQSEVLLSVFSSPSSNTRRKGGSCSNKKLTKLENINNKDKTIAKKVSYLFVQVLTHGVPASICEFTDDGLANHPLCTLHFHCRANLEKDTNCMHIIWPTKRIKISHKQIVLNNNFILFTGFRLIQLAEREVNVQHK